MTARDVLVQARALISDPADWCQNAFFLPDGRICGSEAIYQAARTDSSSDNSDDIEARDLFLRINGETVMQFNDGHTHAEVMAAFDKTISAADTTRRDTHHEGI